MAPRKARFGPAAKLLPYVECDPKGMAAEPGRCNAAAVRRYPTWVVGSGRYEGVMTLEELAKASNFSR